METLEHSDEVALLEALKHPALPVGVLRDLSGHPSPYIREAVARHPNLTSEQAEWLEDDVNAYVLTGLADNPRTPAPVLHRLSDSRFASVRAGVAANPSTPVATLEVLAACELHASDCNRFVLAALANNPRTPQDVLLLLAQSGSPEVRSNVARNQGSGEAVLREVAQRGKDAAWLVARRDDLTLELIVELAAYPHRKVRYVVALNALTPESLVRALLDDEHPSVQRAAAIALERRGLTLASV